MRKKTNIEIGREIGRALLPPDDTPDVHTLRNKFNRVLLTMDKLDLTISSEETWNSINEISVCDLFFGIEEYLKMVKKSRRKPRKSRLKKSR